MLHTLKGRVRKFLKSRKTAELFINFPANPIVKRVGDDPVEITAHPSHVLRDGHFVVIENDEHVLFKLAGAIQRFKGKSRGHGAVSDHGHHFLISFFDIAGRRKSEGLRDRGAGMADDERIVRVFPRRRETTEAAGLAQGVHPVLTSGDHFMDVGLMPDIPADLVFGGIQNVMESDREFQNAEARSQMPAGLGHGTDQKATVLFGDLRQILKRHLLQVLRALYFIDPFHFHAIIRDSFR